MMNEWKEERELKLKRLEECRMEMKQLEADIKNLDKCINSREEKVLVEFQMGLRKKEDVIRYSRPLLLSNGYGIDGQRKLQESSHVLVIGAGGIGSSALLYLAGAGIGHITIVDHDVIDVTNLHRQVIHTTFSGGNKAESARATMLALNPTLQIDAITNPVSVENVLQLVQGANIVLDCTDNAPTRHLLNAACVYTSTPLISGSAIGTDGSITTYTTDGCCYACMYPKTYLQNCDSCNDAGVYGTVPGTIGILAATECLQHLTSGNTKLTTHVLLYDSQQPSFYTMKKPARAKPNCFICSQKSKNIPWMDFVSPLFPTDTSTTPTCTIQNKNDNQYYENVSCQTYYNQIMITNTNHTLLDVRVKRQYDMCSFKHAIHYSLDRLMTAIENNDDFLESKITDIYCICRRGIASAEAAKRLGSYLHSKGKTNYKVYNIMGGYQQWSKQIDSNFPLY